MPSPTNIQIHGYHSLYGKVDKEYDYILPKKEFLVTEVEKIITEDTSGFLSTINDDQYSTKLLIYNALVARAIGREGTDYVIEGKGTIGYNLNEVVDYMNNPANNEDVLKVKARIENAK